MEWQLAFSDLLVVIQDAITLPLFTGGGVLAIILSLPKMWAAFQAFRKLELDAVHIYAIAQQIPVVSAAIKEAQTTGDTSALEALFGKPETSVNR